MQLKETIKGLAYALSDSTFGVLTKNIEIASYKKKLEDIDYKYSEGRWIALSFFSAFFFTILSAITVLLIIAMQIFFDPILLIVPVFVFFLTLVFFLAWPSIDFSRKIKSIEAEMPLAILTMSTAIEAGAPPQYIFDSISNNPDYPRLGREAAKLKRFMEQLGLSFSEALEKTILLSPSPHFKRFLKELNTTIKSGGDLKQFMAKKAEAAYFDYTVKLDIASKNAETMGDIYSIIMIAAPIFLFFTVMLLGIFTGGKGILGFDLNTLMNLSIFLLIPLINTGFILFMELTSPGD